MSITKDFSNDQWREVISGTGSVTVTGDNGYSVVIESPVGSSARKRYYTVGYPGEKVTFTCLARNIPKDGLNGFAGMWIDIPEGTLQNVQLIESLDLKSYTVSAVVPVSFARPQIIAFGVGSFGALDGSAEFIHPIITRQGGGLVMTGFFECPETIGDLPFLREDYYNFGVGDITWDDTLKTVKIKPAEFYEFSVNDPGLLQFRPTCDVTGAPDGNTTESYIFCGSNTDKNGECHIQAVSLTTNAPVDLEAAFGVKRFFKITLITTSDG